MVCDELRSYLLVLESSSSMNRFDFFILALLLQDGNYVLNLDLESHLLMKLNKVP